MKMWIGAAILTTAVAITLAAGGPIATAAPVKPTPQTADSRRATGFSAGRYYRVHARHGYRPQPRYYARPYYYRPYPYSVPAPFTFGFAFGPGWW